MFGCWIGLVMVGGLGDSKVVLLIAKNQIAKVKSIIMMMQSRMTIIRIPYIIGFSRLN